MATTTPPEFPGPVTIDAEKIREQAYDALCFHLRDMDKAGDMEDHAYYAGAYDALYSLLLSMTFPQTAETMKVCIHNNPVWLGHECDECGRSGNGYIWKDAS